MLIKITQSCSMGCTHYCNNALPCDRHMTMNTFIDTLDFIARYEAGLIDSLCGGEPFEHPRIWEFIDKYCKTFPEKLLIIATNGLYLQNNQELIQEKILQYPSLHFQVTSDTRYYPTKIDLTKRIFRNKNVSICTELNHIYPKGRALINHQDIMGQKNKCPTCFNVKLMALQTGNKGLREVIGQLRKQEKLCIPAIQYNGNLAFGEYDECPGYVSIYSKEEEIINSMKNCKCECCPEMFEKLKSNIHNLLPNHFIEANKKYFSNLIGESNDKESQ